MRSVSTLAILLAVAAVSSATLVTIDDFSTLPQSISVNTTGHLASDYATGGTTWGNGSRAITIQNVTSTHNRSATFEIDGGAFGSHGLGVTSRMTSWYGATGTVAPNSAFALVSTVNNYALPGLTGFEFDWLGSDAAVNLIATIYTYDTGLAGFRIKTWSKTIGAGGPQTITLGLGDVTADSGGDANSLSAVLFRVDSTITATDWGMSKFSAVVPEPASMAVLGVGLAAFRRRRRKA